MTNLEMLKAIGEFKVEMFRDLTCSDLWIEAICEEEFLGNIAVVGGFAALATIIVGVEKTVDALYDRKMTEKAIEKAKRQAKHEAMMIRKREQKAIAEAEYQERYKVKMRNRFAELVIE